MEPSPRLHRCLAGSPLRTVGAVAFLWVAAGCVGADAPPSLAPAGGNPRSAAPEPHEVQGGANSGGDSLAASYGFEVAEAVRRIRDVTAPFHNLEEAVAAGYSRTGGRCMEHPSRGGMGYHHLNDDLVDADLDLEQPEILTYQRTPDGGYELTGVEYIVPFDAWSGDKPPSIMGRELRGAPGLGLWYLHVWVWRTNPNGLFADWNPNVRCGG